MTLNIADELTLNLAVASVQRQVAVTMIIDSNELPSHYLSSLRLKSRFELFDYKLIKPKFILITVFLLSGVVAANCLPIPPNEETKL